MQVKRVDSSGQDGMKGLSKVETYARDLEVCIQRLRISKCSVSDQPEHAVKRP